MRGAAPCPAVRVARTSPFVRPLRQLLQIAFALAIAAGFAGYALWDVDLPALGAILAGADYLLVAPFAFLLLAFYVLKAIRWAYLLRSVAALRARDVASPMMIGFAGNNLLPIRLGEVLRVLALARRRSLSIVSVGASVALERLLDMVSMLSLFVLALPFLEGVSVELERGLRLAALAVSGALAVVGALAWAPFAARRGFDAATGWVPERPRRAAREALENALVALATVRSPRRLAVSYANSLFQWSIATGLVWLSLRAVDVAATPALCVLVLVTTGIATAAPSAPGFIGALQAAFVFALAPFGIARESAVAASVIYLVVQWIPVTGAGLVFLAHHVRRYAGLRDAFLPQVGSRAGGSRG